MGWQHCISTVRPNRWNGGNILESFLEIIDHNNITNHLIGVMDDETERYLKVMRSSILG